MFGYDCVCVGSAPTGTHMELEQEQEREQEQGLRLEELLVDPPLNGDHNSIWAVDWVSSQGHLNIQMAFRGRCLLRFKHMTVIYCFIARRRTQKLLK